MRMSDYVFVWIGLDGVERCVGAGLKRVWKAVVFCLRSCCENQKSYCEYCSTFEPTLALTKGERSFSKIY